MHNFIATVIYGCTCIKIQIDMGIRVLYNKMPKISTLNDLLIKANA